MRLTESIQRTGTFFTAADPETQYYGTLTISDGGEIELTLVHTDPVPKLDFSDPKIGRIIGLVEKGYVTLEGCYFRTRNISFGGPSKFIITANYAFVGVGIEEEDYRFSKFYFSIEGLDQWLGRPGLDIDHDWANDVSTLTYKKPEKISATLNDGTAVEINFTYSIPGEQSYPDTVIKQAAYFSIKPLEPEPLRFFTSIARQLSQMLCLFAGQPGALKDVSAALPGTAMQDGTDHIFQVYYQSLPFPPFKKPLNRHFMLLSFPDIEHNFSSIISAWNEFYSVFSPALHQFFLTQDGTHKFVEPKFLGMV